MIFFPDVVFGDAENVPRLSDVVFAIEKIATKLLLFYKSKNRPGYNDRAKRKKFFMLFLSEKTAPRTTREQPVYPNHRSFLKNFFAHLSKEFFFPTVQSIFTTVILLLVLDPHKNHDKH